MTTTTLEQKLLQMQELQNGKNLWQNAFHEFDVYDHTLDYVKHLKTMTSDEEIVAAGYLHDIGKPAVAKLKYKNGKLLEKENGKPYHEFDDHEIVGEQIVRTMNSSLFNDYQLNQERIAKLVGNHFLPMDGIKAMRKTKNYEEFKEEYAKLEQTLDNSGNKREEVLMMFIADCLSKGKGCTDIEELIAIKESLTRNVDFSTQRIYDLQKKMYGGKE